MQDGKRLRVADLLSAQVDLSFDWVNEIKLVIPFFQSEFDTLQVLVQRFGEIPPTGDFGDFWFTTVTTTASVNVARTHCISECK